MGSISVLVLDVDGTLTDGKIYTTGSGEAFKSFNVKDGMGINLALKQGIQVIVITGRQSEIVSYRCKELGIKQLFQGISDKKKLLLEILCKASIPFSEVAYIGDDVNDLEPMKLVGLPMCPNNADSSVKKISKYCSKYNGGEGAVRDCINHIIASD